MGAIDTAHRVEEKNQKTPEGNELKTPFGQSVVTGGVTMTARADCRGSVARAAGDLDAFVIGTEPGMAVDETRKAVTAV